MQNPLFFLFNCQDTAHYILLDVSCSSFLNKHLKAITAHYVCCRIYWGTGWKHGHKRHKAVNKDTTIFFMLVNLPHEHWNDSFEEMNGLYLTVPNKSVAGSSFYSQIRPRPQAGLHYCSNMSLHLHLLYLYKRIRDRGLRGPSSVHPEAYPDK